MAKNGRTLQGATTHSSSTHGHGPTIPRRPFARPVLRAPKGNTAPWFLKQFGERPGENRALKQQAAA